MPFILSLFTLPTAYLVLKASERAAFAEWFSWLNLVQCLTTEGGSQTDTLWQLQRAHFCVLSPLMVYLSLASPTWPAPKSGKHFSVEHFRIATFLYDGYLFPIRWVTSSHVMHHINIPRVLLRNRSPFSGNFMQSWRAFLILKLASLFGQANRAEKLVVIAVGLLCGKKRALRCLVYRTKLLSLQLLLNISA